MYVCFTMPPSSSELYSRALNDVFVVIIIIIIIPSIAASQGSSRRSDGVVAAF